MEAELQQLVPPTARRHALRRIAETRGLVGDLQVPCTDTELRAADGVRLSATYVPGPDDDAPGLVLAHGFAAHRRKPSYAYLADVLSRVAHVLTVDLRGHGGSAGLSTLGDDEALDVAAAVAWLRDRGHERVVAVGSSMGGTSVLHAAGAGHADPDGVVVISTPARLYDEPQTEMMRELHALWTTPWRRAALRVIAGVRLVQPDAWSRPPHPVEGAAGLVVPLLVVHGEDDAYFPLEEGRAIAEAADRATFWHEPRGFGHAEDGFSPAFAAALARAVAVFAAEGRFPQRDEVRGDERDGVPGDGRDGMRGGEPQAPRGPGVATGEAPA